MYFYYINMFIHEPSNSQTNIEMQNIQTFWPNPGLNLSLQAQQWHTLPLRHQGSHKNKHTFYQTD